MDAAESELQGDVVPKTASGVIRYRIWPAKRHPIRTVMAALAVAGATTGTAIAFESPLWAILVFAGCVLGAGVFLFPTEVALDGPTLHRRHLGTPRTWDLREFGRIEMNEDLLPRVELRSGAALNPVERVSAVTLPLPADSAMAEKTLIHLRRWVGRRASGVFELDADHAPDDHVSDEE